MYRHRPELTERLHAMADIRARAVASERGTIGPGARIENVGIIRNVRIGEAAVLQGCLRLFDGTVVSSTDAPVLIGSGVVCTDFIVQSGSVVENGAVVTRSFVGQGVTLSKGFSCSDCLFFANSHCENGEAVSVFAGPFTVSHHKSTLLIGSMFSFMNAGSATNFSNHQYKLGPVHQGVFGRGVKCGSGSYMMLPVRVAPFTTVLGHHTGRIDTPDMPFSYILESEGSSYLVPGVNLRSIGLFRDIRKWPRTVPRYPQMAREGPPQPLRTHRQYPFRGIFPLYGRSNASRQGPAGPHALRGAFLRDSLQLWRLHDSRFVPYFRGGTL